MGDCSTFVDTVLNDTPVRSTLPPVQARLTPITAGENGLEAQVSSPAPWTLSLHAFWTPGWSATVDGRPAEVAPTDAIGVAGVALPAGEHRVQLTFGPTPLRRATTVALPWWRWLPGWRWPGGATAGWQPRSPRCCCWLSCCWAARRWERKRLTRLRYSR